MMGHTIRGSFYGWWIVAGSFVILFITVGIGLYAPPVFLVPLQQHFGWSRAALAGGTAVAAVVVGMVSPLVGAWIDRYGSRAVMTSGAIVMAAAFGLLGYMQALWQLYALNALAAVGIACVGWIPNQTLIANWFSARRGLAMGIATTGIGFGGLAIAPLTAVFIAEFGWRLAFAALSALIVLVGVTVVLAIVRSRPADMGLLPDGDPGLPEAERSDNITGRAPVGLRVEEAVHTGAFWMLALAHFLSVFGSMSIVGHLVAFLRDCGLGGGAAAAALGLMVGVSVGGRVLFGVLADRASTRAIMSSAYALAGITMLLLFAVQSPGALPAFVLSFGMAFGGISVLPPLLVAECFGLLAFAKILGLMMIASTLGGAVGPVLTGHIYDVTGSYQPAFLLHITAFLAAALAIRFLSQPQDLRSASVRRDRSPLGRCDLPRPTDSNL